ncbi:MAG TPA: DUF1702 family protein, partial [Steroidobacteraceae bacterium]|nr:DUF1702 family protein [Steroidobacteraceae bacterium]
MLQRVVSAMRAQLFGISGDQALFRRRGFKSARAKSQHVLEDIGKTFIDGYNFAVRSADPTLQSARLDSIPVDMHGFFVEGASMGFALFDIVSPWPTRFFQEFIRQAASPHIYMAYVGAGWALARTSLRLSWRLGKTDPLLRWLMFDGLGFHHGYF